MKILGHPIHPMLIVFPLGLLATAVIFDILYLIFRIPGFPAASFYMIAAGVIGGLTAALFGFIDWLGLQADTRAKSVGAWHGLGNLTIVLLFAASWLLRLGSANHVPNAPAQILAIGGAALALVTGWLGGEMVYRLGVGVDSGANEDAPSSISTASPVPVTGKSEKARKK